MLHGRGGAPEQMLDLVPVLGRSDVTCVAPAAAGNTWYPRSFMAEIAANEPALSSGLAVIDGLVHRAAEHGVSAEQVVLLGFSQGACLTAEYAARHARRFGGVIVLSGGLIGPPGTAWEYGGSFDGTPVLLGCSDVDPHVPITRLEESAAVFARMDARITKRIYPGMGHLVNDDEIEFIRRLLHAVAPRPGAAPRKA